MKKVLALILSLTLALSLAACGKGGGAPENSGASADEGVKPSDIHLVYVSPLLSHPIWLIAKEGFDAACKELGIEGDWVGPQGLSAEEMAQLVDTAVAQGANGIITQSICPAEPINNAIAAGVAVLMVDGDLEEVTGKLAYLGKEYKTQAELFYQEALKYVGEDGKITMSIQCPALNAQNYIDQNDAIVAAFENHPGGFELVNITLSNSDKATGTNEWLNTFNTYPEVNVCINVAAEAGPACVTAADELGITDNLIILGVDDTDENLQYVRDGKIKGTTVVSFWNYGYQAAYWLYQNITEGRVPAQKVNDAGTMMVTLENIDSYNELLKVKVDLPK